MSHQDWKPVIFNKSKQVKPKQGPGRSHATKLEESEETKVKRFPMDLVKQIIQYRVDKGMNRKQFAQSLNISVGMLAEIESGKAPHNGAMVGRFKRMINNHNKSKENDKK